MEPARKPEKIVSIQEHKTFIVGGIFWLLFGLALYFLIIPWQIEHADPINNTSPRTVPHILSGLFILCGPLLAMNGFLMRDKPDQKIYVLNLHRMRLVLYSLLIVAANIIAFEYIGYIIPAIITIAALMLLYGNRSYIKIATLSITIPIAIYIFFRVGLQMYLPNPFTM